MANPLIIDFAELLTALPKRVAYPLAPQHRAAHGVCWIGDPKAVPTGEAALRDYLGASQEEIDFFNNNDGTKKILCKYDSGIMKKTKDTEEEDNVMVEVGLGKDLSTGELLYACCPVESDTLLVGRVKEENITRLFKNIALLENSLDFFAIQPNRIASGEDYYCSLLSESIKAYLHPIPWNFTFLNSANAKGLQEQIASTLAMHGQAERLWIMCIQEDHREAGEFLTAAVFEWILAGGQKQAEPQHVFDALNWEAGEVTEGGDLAAFIFWRNK